MTALRPALNAQDHVQGRPDAPIQVVEYGDYECPFCSRAHLIVKAVQRAMGDDLLFQNQQFLEDGHLLRYAGLIGCDVDQFAQDIDSEEVAEKVRSDFLSGARSGVNGTPTFFINGERYDASWEPDVLLSVLQELRGVRELR